jgi:uncharacterized protein (TIGR00369 family)
MNDSTDSVGVRVVRDGEFRGWSTWLLGEDPLETSVGPFYFRDEADGATRCAVLPQKRHCNAAGVIHGGFLMTFADFALFAIARRKLHGHAVTVSLHSDFLAAAFPDSRIEASGQIVRTTRTLVFVRGLMEQGGKTIFMFSGIIKKLPRPHAEYAASEPPQDAT